MGQWSPEWRLGRKTPEKEAGTETGLLGRTYPQDREMADRTAPTTASILGPRMENQAPLSKRFSPDLLVHYNWVLSFSPPAEEGSSS